MDEGKSNTQQKPPAKNLTEVVIAIKGLKKAFGEKAVLKGINLELKRSENVVVLGRSGVGKSVAIQCIVGLLKPDGGSLKVFGDEVAGMSDSELKQLRIKTGFLFQGGALYDSMTVRENLEFPLTRQLLSVPKDTMNSLVKEALQNVGLAKAIDLWP